MDAKTATQESKPEPMNDNPPFNFRGITATAIVLEKVYSQREGRLRTECKNKPITRVENDRGVKRIIELPLTDVGSGAASAIIPRSLLYGEGAKMRKGAHLTLKLAEFGGTSTDQPSNIARIVCDENGKRLSPIYVKREEDCELSGEVAYFGKSYSAIRCVATAKKLGDRTEIVEIDQITMRQNDQELTVQTALIASFLRNEDGEVRWQTEGFEEVIDVALEKLHCDGHFGVGTGCTLPHYCLTKEGEVRKVKVNAPMNKGQTFFSPKFGKKNSQTCANCPATRNSHEKDVDNPDPGQRNRLVCPSRI